MRLIYLILILSMVGCGDNHISNFEREIEQYEKDAKGLFPPEDSCYKCSGEKQYEIRMLLKEKSISRLNTAFFRIKQVFDASDMGYICSPILIDVNDEYGRYYHSCSISVCKLNEDESLFSQKHLSNVHYENL